MARHVAYEEFEEDLSPQIRAQLARWDDEEVDLYHRRHVRRSRQVSVPARRRIEEWRDARVLRDDLDDLRDD